MIELDKIRDIENCLPGDQIAITLYLADMQELETSSHSPYVRLYWRDTAETISIPLWDRSLAECRTAYSVDSVYTLCGIVSTYKGRKVINRLLSAVEVTDEKVIRKLKPHLYKSYTDRNSKLVRATVDSLAGTKYGPYVCRFYGRSSDSDEYRKMLTEYASAGHHDNYPGGLINHVGGMLSIAAQMKSTYLKGRCEKKWDIDWQYITVGILLHDIGKTLVYTEVSPGIAKYKDGCLLDHNRLGVGLLYWVHLSIPEDERLDEAVLQQLAYTISYHDDRDHLYEHKRMEDKVISYIDGLDAVLATACSLDI